MPKIMNGQTKSPTEAEPCLNYGRLVANIHATQIHVLSVTSFLLITFSCFFFSFLPKTNFFFSFLFAWDASDLFDFRVRDCFPFHTFLVSRLETAHRKSKFMRKSMDLENCTHNEPPCVLS